MLHAHVWGARETMGARQVSTWNVVLSRSSTAGNETKSLHISFEGSTTPPYGELKNNRRACCTRAVSPKRVHVWELHASTTAANHGECILTP
jgi:hypothetical protein